MDIITGYTGEAHVRSEDDAAFNSAIFKADCILPLTNEFAETHTNNAISIGSGDLLIKGHHARIRDDDVEEFSFTPPGSGFSRIDIIFVCYSKKSTGIEDVYLEYVSGTASHYGAIPPSNPTIDLSNVDFSYYPLYTLTFDGTSLTTVTKNSSLLTETGATFTINVGSAADGTVSATRLRISENFSLLFGQGSFSSGIAANTDVTIWLSGGTNAFSKIICGAVQVNTTSAQMQQLGAMCSSSGIWRAIKPAESVTGGTISFIAIESN